MTAATNSRNQLISSNVWHMQLLQLLHAGQRLDQRGQCGARQPEPATAEADDSWGAAADTRGQGVVAVVRKMAERERGGVGGGGEQQESADPYLCAGL
jgi:hypothetical protein